MTVAELIRELQAYPPHVAVRVVPSQAVIRDELGETMLGLCQEDATEADEVRHMGPYVLVQGK